MEIVIKDWGDINEDVKLFTLINSKGNSISVTNYGATLVSIIVPDKNEIKSDVILGFLNINGYLADTCYIGSTIGRYAGRIENAKFKIDGKVYKLNSNIQPHILHGGGDGFNKRIWKYRVTDNKGVVFELISPDGDQGFPGNLHAEVEYIWNDNNELRINFRSKSDKSTHVNLTNHAYFNLRGDDGSILDHKLKINSVYYLPMNDGSIITGEFSEVTNTPFDFTIPKSIGNDINSEDKQLKLAGGYDHSFVLKTENNRNMILASEVYEPNSGRKMEVYTTYPSIHLYTGNFLTSIMKGKNNKYYNKQEAFCLETQYIPNTPNHSSFPSSLLKPEEEYFQTTLFKFC